MEIKVGVYKHYKGKNYKVIGLAKHSETLQEFVVYEALYDDAPLGKLWIRPIELFTDTVLFEGNRVPHFVFLHD